MFKLVCPPTFRLPVAVALVNVELVANRLVEVALVEYSCVAVNPVEEALLRDACPPKEKLPVPVALEKNSCGIVAPPVVEALTMFALVAVKLVVEASVEYRLVVVNPEEDDAVLNCRLVVEASEE